ncbi:MAG: hypothetical protein DVB25_01635 [Verrucomicrobia bacterium]|nr:MAG: hypothetical protein DVB25_01635 [Verrucomicrobiota bacterium]
MAHGESISASPSPSWTGKGEKVVDRCHLTVIGYGERTELILSGCPSQIENPPHGTMSLTRKVSDGTNCHSANRNNNTPDNRNNNMGFRVAAAPAGMGWISRSAGTGPRPVL